MKPSLSHPNIATAQLIDLMHAGPGRVAAAPDAAIVDVEIVIPTYNEERALATSIYRLHSFLSAQGTLSWRIVIADNASTDCTPEIAYALADQLSGVKVVRLAAKGRGRALRTAWSQSRARVVAYMDVDLSTDLNALAPLVAPLLSGHSQVAIGTRLGYGARVTRGPQREFISRSYNRILRLALHAQFTDAQCGFKAVRADALAQLLPEVKDQEWFFDTELLVAAQRRGMRIHEVPVDWVDDPDSRVDILATAMADLRGVSRLIWDTSLARFMAVGVVSTAAYGVLFLLLAGVVGHVTANALTLAITAVGNTAANRRLSFGVRGREGLVRQHSAGLMVFLIALGLTAGAQRLLFAIDPHAARGLELAVLIIATLASTVCRYVALRTWVFADERHVVVAPRTGLRAVPE
jgi:putative flippase GtrA